MPRSYSGRTKCAILNARRASLNWQGSGLEIHRAARPLGVRIPRPPPLRSSSRNSCSMRTDRKWGGTPPTGSIESAPCRGWSSTGWITWCLSLATRRRRARSIAGFWAWRWRRSAEAGPRSRRAPSLLRDEYPAGRVAHASRVVWCPTDRRPGETQRCRRADRLDLSPRSRRQLDRDRDIRTREGRDRPSSLA